MEFQKINAKVCPNVKCKQVIPEEWKAAYKMNWCPRCNYGFSEEKRQKFLHEASQ